MRRPKCDIKRTREEYGRMEQNNIEKDFFTPHTYTHTQTLQMSGKSKFQESKRSQRTMDNKCLFTL